MPMCWLKNRQGAFSLTVIGLCEHGGWGRKKWARFVRGAPAGKLECPSTLQKTARRPKTTASNST
jgi:hypothetical protein